MVNENTEELSVRDVVQKIRDKALDPAVLSKETRQACVETLFFEGCQQSAIAQFLKKSDRTIRRDMDEIRKRYAVKQDPETTKALIADFIFKANVHHAYLMRLARSAESSVADKSKAEALAWKINKEVIQELCYIGLLVVTDEISKAKKNQEIQLSEEEKKLLKITDILTPLERDTLLNKLKLAILEMAENSAQKKPNDEKTS